jgi:anti-sigma B factor antagonist
MAHYRRIQLSQVSGSAANVTLVRFIDCRIIDATTNQELGEELFGLVEKEGAKALVLNFVGVDFLSSAALNKLIMLDTKVKAAGGKMRLCGLKPEIHDVFVITKLTQVFDIKSDEDEALSGF